MRYRITTPVAGFTGVSAGVNFTNSVAEIEAPLPLPPVEGRELSRAERVERNQVTQHEGYRKLAYFTSQGYGVEQVDEDAAKDEGNRPFDPSEHGVDEVLDYLASVTDDTEEHARVIAAEISGKNRKTIVEKGAAA